MTEETGQLKQELTMKDLKLMFNRTKTTIYVWRKRHGLPFFRLSGNALSDPVRYRVEEVQKWAQEHGKDIINPVYVSKGIE